jgi:hypothetical protein
VNASLFQTPSNVPQSLMVLNAKPVAGVCIEATGYGKWKIRWIEIHKVAAPRTFYGHFEIGNMYVDLRKSLGTCPQSIPVTNSRILVPPEWHIELTTPIDAEKAIEAGFVEEHETCSNFNIRGAIKT